jgi:hypothetical protein
MRTENVSTSIRSTPHHRGRIEHHLAERVVVPGFFADALKHVRDPAELHRGRDGHIDDGSGPVAGQIGHLRDLAVGSGDDLAADRPDTGDTEGDVLDGADGRLRHPGNRNPDDVTEAVLAFRGDEEPGTDVRDKSLQAEPQCLAEQGGAADQARQGHAAATRQCGSALGW